MAISKKPEEVARAELDALRDEDRMTPDLVLKDPYFLDFLIPRPNDDRHRQYDSRKHAVVTTSDTTKRGEIVFHQASDGAVELAVRLEKKS